MYFKKILYTAATLFCFCLLQARAQQRTYTVSNAHAHNDYEHPVPFYMAYEAGFGSIEADIFLQDGKLCVAHNKKDITPQRTLEFLYLTPLQKAIEENKGFSYKDTSKHLLLLIDVKTEAEPTLATLVQVLQQYKALTTCSGLKIVITGNQPEAAKFNDYPSYLYFDGNLNKTYPPEIADRIALFSHNFRNYTVWNGNEVIADEDRGKIAAAVSKAHSLNKPIRFWAAPDTPNVWRQLMALNVDYINTDKIPEISAFLKQASQ